MSGVLSMFSPSYPTTLVYMLQSTEYQPRAYLDWLWRTNDFSTTMKRRSLEPTLPARLLLLSLRLGIGLELLVGLILVYMGFWQGLNNGVLVGLALIAVAPLVWAHLLIVPLAFGRWLIIRPRQNKLVERSRQIFANHPGLKLAVAGSYGKTTMKELLVTVLAEGKKVAATPANKNVAVSHAYFAQKLVGDEDILIIEYGESAPGDIVKFARNTQPDRAVITGLAPAHLDHYKTEQAAGEDIFSLADYVPLLYVNNDSPDAQPFLRPTYELFDQHQALGWKVSRIKVDFSGTSFRLARDGKGMTLHSQLVGRHQVAYLAFVAAFALEEGLTDKQVKAGLAKTEPFEHRMQPYQLNGAWIIDDTYNGNLEGIRAGTALLKDLPAKRKIYVTPGLVDQGQETERVHQEVGRLIAAAKPDITVLMNNAVTGFIRAGLKEADYKGELRVEDDPLDFYTNLNHLVANGDLVVMQNDWTDNYA